MQTQTSSPISLGPGGRRPGAGRKAGGQNRDTEDRSLLCAWLCDWFARSLEAKYKHVVSDSDCEAAVNNCFAENAPEFQSEKSTLGGMWAKARRGDRPFSASRMAAVAAAADALKFWDPRWRYRLHASGESDPLSLLLLSLLAVEGVEAQTEEKQEFKKRKGALLRALTNLAASSEKTFERRRAAALESLQAWDNFSASMSAGRIYISADVEASIESGVDDPRRWVLHPTRTAKRLAKVQFHSRLDPVDKARWQVWALEYRAHNFSDSSIMLSHLRKLKNGRNPAAAPVEFLASDEQNPFADIEDLMAICTDFELAQN